MNCPHCSTQLVLHLVTLPDDVFSLTAPRPTYVQAYSCPNGLCGLLVQCEHDCGELVPNARYHYSYVEGLFGSGRWSCFPKRQTQEQLERWERALRDSGDVGNVGQVPIKLAINRALAERNAQWHELLAALRARREELGLTQRDVAERMGVFPQDVSRLESGGAEPTASKLLRYAAAIGVRMEFAAVELSTD